MSPLFDLAELSGTGVSSPGMGQGEDIWRTQSTQFLRSPSRLRLQVPTERQADTVGASIAAGVAGMVGYAPQAALGAPLRIFFRGLLPLALASPEAAARQRKTRGGRDV